jgi:aminomuconate-semialdehyde/2-hydroxymuconate-6-semialdehyde dehydrogenase
MTTPGTLHNFIGGRFVATGQTFDKISPVDGSLVARVHEADRAVVDQAVAAAQRALDGPWGRSTVPERVALMRRVADRIEERFDDLSWAGRTPRWCSPTPTSIAPSTA